MVSAAQSTQGIYQHILVNYLISMARTVESSVDRALSAILQSDTDDAEQAPGEIFLLEPRINEMEMVIDDHAVRMLRDGHLTVEDIRQVVATLKITNDLERIGDLAVNLAERVVSLAEMGPVARPPELEPMVEAVGAMVKKSLGALIFRSVVLAGEVLESDDLVDRYRDQIFERLMASMSERPAEHGPNMQFVLASRFLERVPHPATNITEILMFGVRGLEVRHGRGLEAAERSAPVIENS